MRQSLAKLALGLLLGLGLASPSWGQAAARTKASSATKAKAKVQAAKIDLNTATAEELQELPGVGPARAAAIIKARPFKAVDELKSLKGLPADTFDEIAPRVTVGEAASTPRKAATKAMTKGETARAKAAAKGESAAGGKVDLNTATADELQELPGIGPSRAEAILKARPFKSVADLKKVEDVPARVYNEIEPRLTASAPTVVSREPAAKVMTKPATPRATAATKEAAKEDSAASQNRKKSALAAGRKINLNTAGADELQELPGIGPVRSAAILKARPFETIEDVMKVDGIKEGIFGQIKDHISVK